MAKFGENDPVMSAPAAATFFSADPVVGTAPPSRQRVDSVSEAVFHGLQSSATGLAIRGKLPEQVFGEDAPWQQRIASGAGSVAGDFLLSVGGAIVGGAVGSAVAPGAGTVVGGGAGAFAVPMALREALIEAYSNDHAMSWSGVWEIAKAGIWGATKGAVIGGATAGTGRVVAPLLTRAGGGAVATAVGTAGAELATLTTTAAALEGHMPTWQDFMDNAILLGGMKSAMYAAGALRNIYAQTGKRPEQVVVEAQKNPALKAQLLDPKAQGIPDVYQPLALEQRVKAALDVEQSGLVSEIVKQAQNPDAPTKPIVRYEYITDKATAEGVIREVANKFSEHVETQRRGTVKTEQSFKAGAKLVEEGTIKPHEIGRAVNDGQVVARAILTKGAAERARQLAAEIAELPPERITLEHKLQLAGALDQVRMFYGELAGAGAEAGRALRILREIKRNPDRLGDAQAMLKAYETSKGGKIEDIAALARTITTPEGMRVFAEKVQKATTFDMVIEGWKAGILSGIHTTGANVIGNTARWTVETALTNPLTQTFEAARLAMKGDPMPLAVYKARIMGPIMGVQLGAADALKIAAEVWKEQGAHLEKSDVYKAAIPGKTGKVVRLPFKILQMQDVIFRTFAEREKAYVLAVERAAKEGRSPGTREFNEAVQRYTDQPQLGLTEKQAQAITAKIEQHGAESVFTQKLGPKMEMFSLAIQGTPAEFIMPFRRTPINLVSWSLQYTPVLNFMSARWLSDVKAGGELRSRALARVAIGTGIALAAYEMAEDGILTGSGLFDSEMSRTKRGAGWQPNSLHLGGEYYSIERIEPVAKIFITAANLYELQKAAKEKEDKAKLGAMAVALFANATISTTYMSGLSNAMAAAKEPERYMDSFLESYAASLVPKIVGQTVMTLDPEKREVDGVVEAIQSQLPYFRSKLLPARDVWGEPAKNDKWFYVMPISVSKEAEDKVKTEAVRLAIGLVDAPKYLQEGDQRIQLTPEQRNLFKELAGKAAMKDLARIVNSPDWERIPTYAQVEIYREAFKDAREEATDRVLAPNDPARIEARKESLDKLMRELRAIHGKPRKQQAVEGK